MRRLRMIAVSVVFGGAFAGTLALGGGSVLAATMPAGPSPGFTSASYAGSCHGVFGDYFGIILSSSGTGFSTLAPVGSDSGQDNAFGCPYAGDSDSDG